jgi:GNAT superfamily N-acetyltransferase
MGGRITRERRNPFKKSRLLRVIAPVTELDVPEVIALVAEVLAEYGLEFGKGTKTDDDLRGLPASYASHGGAFWVGRGEAGELLGTAGVFPVAPYTFELRKMYLRPAARGHGLGSRLLAVAEAFVRGEGGHLIVLDTIEAMASACRFYEARGFVRDDAQIRAARATVGYAKRL